MKEDKEDINWVLDLTDVIKIDREKIGGHKMIYNTFLPKKEICEVREEEWGYWDKMLVIEILHRDRLLDNIVHQNITQVGIQKFLKLLTNPLLPEVADKIDLLFSLQAQLNTLKEMEDVGDDSYKDEILKTIEQIKQEMTK
jgi:hypothetical protein